MDSWAGMFAASLFRTESSHLQFEGNRLKAEATLSNHEKIGSCFSWFTWTKLPSHTKVQFLMIFKMLNFIDWLSLLSCAFIDEIIFTAWSSSAAFAFYFSFWRIGGTRCRFRECSGTRKLRFYRLLCWFRWVLPERRPAYGEIVTRLVLMSWTIARGYIVGWLGIVFILMGWSWAGPFIRHCKFSAKIYDCTAHTRWIDSIRNGEPERRHRNHFDIASRKTIGCE